SRGSRALKKRTRAESESVDISAMLAALCEIYSTGELPQKVLIEIAGEPPFNVNAIEDRLVQVFRNLLQNAISFSPEDGQVVMHVSRRDGFVEIDVVDDGPGLPEGKLDAVFDRFYSERPEGEKFGTHSGLGLSISKQIVEGHGGDIHAENRYSADGKVRGARFVVRLPRADD
ncbi:MAG: ATP-binding protein, partial [Rickettsiales bacterium]